MNAPEIGTILDLLRKEYGKRKLEPHRDPLAELVQTILSQNTSDLNSRPAFNALKAEFPNWEDLLTVDIDMIAGPISRGGLGQIKAQRIQQSLQEIQRRRGKLDLNFLDKMPVAEARDWLKKLPGVGDKTANCVLLFALGKPALPVDTHIFRVAKRLGLLREQAALEEAHQTLEKMVPPADIYEFHVLMIEHGRSACAAQRPHCSQCSLQMICPSYESFNGHSAGKSG
jgi:endonuclease III